VGARGPKELSARDWLLGSRPRRLALEALLSVPPRAWRVQELVERCGVGSRGLDSHLRGLEHLGLAVRTEAGWVAPARSSPLARPLRALLRALEHVDEVGLDELGARPRANGDFRP
jgi:hypothetical protein